ncbi:MAG TPA: potassium-transporting ATPase subunit KdpC [Legionellaceae bacterium]|nr:potassium-transporting ATPase subunit KdpC [Legionellaceae bacterium]
MNHMGKLLGQACRLLLLFSVMTGLIYPFLITGLAQLVFPWRANGSLLFQEQHCIGSELLGQSFTDTRYFWGRPSATADFPYNALASGGSNWGPTNPDYIQAVRNRIIALGGHTPIPVDLVTASASGLDPHISVEAAYYQAVRIARVRHMSLNRIHLLIDQYTQPRLWRIIGDPLVSVLQLNIALDTMKEE